MSVQDLKYQIEEAAAQVSSIGEELGDLDESNQSELINLVFWFTELFEPYLLDPPPKLAEIIKANFQTIIDEE